jgi:hypothetical protein
MDTVGTPVSTYTTLIKDAKSASTHAPAILGIHTAATELDRLAACFLHRHLTCQYYQVCPGQLIAMLVLDGLKHVQHISLRAC